MDDEKPSVSFLARYRSPTFSRNEVQMLLDIIDKHKYTILNKSTNSAINQAKELTWERITKTFNSSGFKHERTLDALKTKWDNLKKEARKHAKSLVDGEITTYNDMTKQIVSIMYDVEHNAPMETSQDLDDHEEFIEPGLNDEKVSQNLKRKSCWEGFDGKNSDESNEGNNEEGRANRSLNFAPQECSLLLECVRKEKSHVFSKGYNAHSIGLKNKAWRRVTEAFNKKSPQKRSQKVLRTKFNNMKTVAKNMTVKDAVKNFDLNTKHEKLINDNSKSIKSEPVFEVELHEPEDDEDRHNSDSNHFAPDPLSTVLNSDSGIGSTHSRSWSQANKEVAKLKLELLNYKMETAMLERRRLEEAGRAEAASREALAITTALRLRAARLAAVAAAAALPAAHAHAAALFPPPEQPAERYLRQCQYEHT